MAMTLLLKGTKAPALLIQGYRLLSTTAMAMAPSKDVPPGVHMMETHPHLSFEADRPPLSSNYPNISPGTKCLNQVVAPEPSWEVLHTKHIIVGDASDATEIAEFDRVHAPGKQAFGSGAGLTDTGM